MNNAKKSLTAFIGIFAMSTLAGCGSPADTVEGHWVSASMKDGMECQFGRAMVISGDTITFGVANQAGPKFEGLETEVADNGNIIMKSDSFAFEFSPGEEDGQITMVSAPFVREHTDRLPREMARC